MKRLALNVGCGDRVYKEYPEGYECINMDNRVDLPDVDLIADVRDISFPDNTFDYVLASDLIEHFTIKETKNLLLEWKRVLKPDGVLEIRTPNLEFLAKYYVEGIGDGAHPHPADFFSYHVFGGQGYPGNFHYVLFDRGWLSLICKECGLNEFEYEEVAQNFIMKVKKREEKIKANKTKDNVILRPVFNRPEMLALSIEYEKKAREYVGGLNNITTVFIVEHGSPDKVLELVNKYPYEKKIIKREKKLGLTVNILEGMKNAFDLADNFIIHLEDDVLLHETYFKYIKTALSVDGVQPFSILSPYNFNDAGNVHDLRKEHHYAALAPMITKQFFESFVRPCAVKKYYDNKPKFVTKLNEKYRDHWEGRRYKYRDTTHWEQAGLINRLVDVAMIEKGMYVILPFVNRQQHIGYFGKNRPGGIIPGNSYEERLENLREIIKDADKMYELSATKQYNDYRTFSPKLDEWDGTLRLING
jgi:predicted SAM-dependent methyltransferase